jgi:hypothetical protein
LKILLAEAMPIDNVKHWVSQEYLYWAHAPGAPPVACLFLSRFLGRRFWYPHFLQYFARIELVALQFMQTRFINNLASASGNLAM